MSLTIRPFQTGDLPALEQCIIEMQEAERSLDPRLRPGLVMAQAYAEQLRARCATQTGVILIAAFDGDVVGFAAVQARVPYEELDDPPGEYALVSDLVVLAAYRRRGIGQALLAAAESHARAQQARELRIGVLANNTAAHHLYSASGFTPYLELFAKAL